MDRLPAAVLRGNVLPCLLLADLAALRATSTAGEAMVHAMGLTHLEILAAVPILKSPSNPLRLSTSTLWAGGVFILDGLTNYKLCLVYGTPLNELYYVNVEDVCISSELVAQAVAAWPELLNVNHYVWFEANTFSAVLIALRFNDEHCLRAGFQGQDLILTRDVRGWIQLRVETAFSEEQTLPLLGTIQRSLRRLKDYQECLTHKTNCLSAILLVQLVCIFVFGDILTHLI